METFLSGYKKFLALLSGLGTVVLVTWVGVPADVVGNLVTSLDSFGEIIPVVVQAAVAVASAATMVWKYLQSEKEVDVARAATPNPGRNLAGKKG